MARGDRQNSDIHTEFIAARTAARAAVEKAKKDSWERFVSSINPENTSKELWDKVNRLNGKKSGQPIKLRFNNDITDNPSLISELLADHFYQASSSSNYSNQFLSHKSNLENNPPSFETDNNLEYNSDFSYDELAWALQRVHGSSAGPDDVGYPLLKNLPRMGKCILLNIYNNIWNQGELTSPWKEG
jgi:hypothetical protein